MKPFSVAFSGADGEPEWMDGHPVRGDNDGAAVQARDGRRETYQALNASSPAIIEATDLKITPALPGMPPA